jgi:hypothetical protein
MSCFIIQLVLLPEPAQAMAGDAAVFAATVGCDNLKRSYQKPSAPATPEHSIVNPVALLQAVLQDAMGQQATSSQKECCLVISPGGRQIGQ